MAGPDEKRSSENPIAPQTSTGAGSGQPRVYNIVGPKGRQNVLDNTGTLQPDRTDTVILYEGNVCKQKRHVEYDLKIEQETRKKEFEKVDSKLRDSYFSKNGVVEEENEVLRLEKALSTVSESFKLVSSRKELRKVRVGEAMLWFLRILGWIGGTTWIKWLKREIEEEIPKFNDGYDKYFQDLKINAKEISDAVEILAEDGDDEFEYSAPIGDSMKKGKSVQVGIKEGVCLKKNKYGAIRIEGNGDMYNFVDDVTNERHTWIGTSLKKIKGVIVKGGVTRIGNMAFMGCDVPSVTIRDGVKSIGKFAFCDCKQLACVTIPGSVKDIEEGAFKRCYHLAGVIIEEGVNNISDEAFMDCSNLKKVVIPKSVTSIGDRAFKNCSGLKEVFCWGRCRLRIGSEAFPSTVTIYVYDPNHEFNTQHYRQDWIWKNYKVQATEN